MSGRGKAAFAAQSSAGRSRRLAVPFSKVRSRRNIHDFDDSIIESTFYFFRGDYFYR